MAEQDMLQAALDELRRIDQKVTELLRVESISGQQIVVAEGLSDIDGNLGLVVSGEFRAGNGIQPGLGFTGVRIGYPEFTYGDTGWHVVGVNSDTLQFGLRASDGVAVFGAGAVTLGATGMLLQTGETQTSTIIWRDVAGNDGTNYGLVYGFKRGLGDSGWGSLTLLAAANPSAIGVNPPVILASAGRDSDGNAAAAQSNFTPRWQPSTVFTGDDQLASSNFHGRLVQRYAVTNASILDGFGVSDQFYLEDDGGDVHAVFQRYIEWDDVSENIVEIRYKSGINYWHVYHDLDTSTVDIVVNEDGGDVNVRIETSNNPYGLDIDAGLDAIGVMGAAVEGTALTVYGDVVVLHTAASADEHAMEIDVDAAGFGDIKAIDIDYISGAIQAGEDEGVILINIDETQALGGDIFGLEILATDGLAGIYGMKTGVQIGPIHQDAGVFENPTTATDNTPSSDVAAMMDGDTGTTTAIFEADNEYIIIGAAAPFQELELILTTASSKNIKPTFWYSINGGSGNFTQFTPVDGTDGCLHTGVIAWDASDLTGHVADATTGTFDIKIIRTKGGSITNPVLGYAKVASTTEYIWDKDGNVNINDITVAGTASIGGALVTKRGTNISSSSDNADVTGVGWVVVTTSGGNITIGGLSGGVTGQVLYIIKGESVNSLIIEHDEATGTQKFLNPGNADITIGVGLGGITVVFTGVYWSVVEQ